MGSESSVFNVIIILIYIPSLAKKTDAHIVCINIEDL